jgi:hypothetical protein
VGSPEPVGFGSGSALAAQPAAGGRASLSLDFSGQVPVDYGGKVKSAYGILNYSENVLSFGLAPNPGSIRSGRVEPGRSGSWRSVYGDMAFMRSGNPAR